eukprot:6178226-Pleurochrysis_carterae.AAC.4
MEYDMTQVYNNMCEFSSKLIDRYPRLGPGLPIVWLACAPLRGDMVRCRVLRAIAPPHPL